MTVSVSVEGHIATVSLDRPQARNALSVELCDSITSSIEEINSGDARVVVLRGEGKVFCSGADFAAVSGPGGIDFLPAFERMLETVARCRVPVIARIHGAALGGGLQLATACDFRIAADDAVVGIPSSRLGIVINFENVQRLALLTGIPVAKEVLMAARTYTGSALKDAGLVNEVVPADRLDASVNDLAEKIATLSPLSVQGAKAALGVVADQLLGRSDDGGEARIAELVAAAYHSADLQEGLAAMSEKRPPRFEGK